MFVSSFLTSFLNTYSLPTSSIRCQALFTVMSFLDLWFLYQNSALVHFKYAPERLKRRARQVFITLMRFLLYYLVSSSFSRSPDVFIFFPFILAYLMVSPFQYSQIFVGFHFFELSNFFSRFGRSIISVIYRFPHFYSKFYRYVMTVYAQFFFLSF